MIRRSLGEVAVMCGGRTGFPAVMITGVSTDTRTLSPGNLYVPLKGQRFDGHQFAAEAAARGAAAALWSSSEVPAPHGLPLVLVEDTLTALQSLAASYRRQLSKTRVIAVTGSNGKTSVKDMLLAVLSTKYRTEATEGNLNSETGLPLTLLSLSEAAEMAVVEMGMSGRGEISLLSKLARPDVAIITSIGEAHLADLGSLEQIALAKLEILEGLTAGGLFVANGDSPLLQDAIRERAAITFGNAEQNQFRATDVRLLDEGMVFRVNGFAEPVFRLPLLGKHQVVNALGAIAAAQALGLDLGSIARGLAAVKATERRGELLRCGLTTIINDTYKSNPASVRAALDTLCSLSGYGKRIAVLGDMRDLGAVELESHTAIGRSLDPTLVDNVITIGEAARQISRTCVGRFPAGRVHATASKEEAFAVLQPLLGKEPVLLLIKGANVLALQDLAQAIERQA